MSRRAKLTDLPPDKSSPKPTYIDLVVGKVLVMPGSAKNEYKIMGVTKKEVKLLRLKDNQESVLSTESLLRILR